MKSYDISKVDYSDCNTILDLYRKQIFYLEEFFETVQNTEISEEVAKEIDRLKTHVARLENDHADCVELCCPGCTQGGLEE